MKHVTKGTCKVLKKMVPQLFGGIRESLSEEVTSSEMGRKNITEGGALQRKEEGELEWDAPPREERGGTMAGVGHADRLARLVDSHCTASVLSSGFMRRKVTWFAFVKRFLGSFPFSHSLQLPNFLPMTNDVIAVMGNPWQSRKAQEREAAKVEKYQKPLISI